MLMRYDLILKCMAFVLAMVSIFNSSSFNMLLISYYYAFGILFLLWIPIMKNSNIKILSFPMLGVIVSGILSIVLNNIPHYYQSEQRFIMFVCLTTLIGPLIGGNKFNYFRKNLFRYVIVLIVIFSVLSYLGLVTGVYRGVALTRYGTVRPDFTGFFSSSMLLSPMAGIAVLSCLYFFWLNANKYVKSVAFIGALLCVLSAITAGSRSALMGLIAGILFFFYKLYQDNLGRFVKIIVLIVMAGVFSFPLWENRTAFLKTKFERSEEAGDWASSREALWEQRIKEFGSSPIYGIGFAAEDVNFSDIWDEETVEQGGGKVEPGSSWLAILSMTGILGFIPMFLIFASDYIFILTNRKDQLKLAYLGGLLSLFVIHMFAEGYIFAFGSLLFFCLWLLLGIIQITKDEFSKKPVMKLNR